MTTSDLAPSTTRRGATASLPPYTGVAGLLALLVIYFSISADGFLTTGNVNSLLGDASVTAILAIGLTPTIISGGIDLSVASNALLCAVVAVWTAEHVGTFAAVVAAIAVGSLIGAINGVLIARFGLNPFVVTLAALQVWRGFSRLLVDDTTQSMSTFTFSSFTSWSVGPVNAPIVLTLLLAVAATWLLRRTYFGRNVYAIGGNEKAARIAGLPVERSTILVYVWSGMCAGIASLLLVGFNADSVSPTVLSGAELTVAAAVLLGGTSLIGGAGTITGSVIAALFFSVLSKGLNLNGVTASYWQLIVTGVLLVVAIVIDRARAKRNPARTV
ncbi:MAG: ABC transporter permease [Aeromicrobium sp.]